MMAGVAIVGILAAVSVPAISGFLRSQNEASGSSQLASHLRVARSRAILEGNDYLVQFVGNNQYRLVDDDGGGNGIPGAAGYAVANRMNGRADDGELILGPFELPRDIMFATVNGIENPFTGEDLDAAVTFPESDGHPTAVFHANGTADTGGFVAMQPQVEIDRDHASRCRVLRVVPSTGAVESRPAGRG
jgi:type II secretory pathway pseudopilin PulG